DLGERDVRDRVDLTGQERVHLGRLRRGVDHGDLVEVGLTGAPVVGVADVHALLPGGEARGLEGAGADPLQRALAAVAGGHHAVVVLAELLGDGRVRGRQVQAHGLRIHDVDV